MKTVLAALDCSLADTPVVEIALGLAGLFGASVDAVHVGSEPARTAENVASMADLSLRRLSGPVVRALLAALDDPHVIAGVLGTRGLPMGRRPDGNPVPAVLEQTGKPVVVVPPQAFDLCPPPFRRILVPLDGTDPADACVSGALDALVRPGTEVVVLHVFDDRTRLPIFNHDFGEFDQHGEFARWGEEFLGRHLPGTPARLECRSGHAASHIVEVSGQLDVDLVIVSWAQVLEGHGHVVRALLSKSKVPVLVMPSGGELSFG